MPEKIAVRATLGTGYRHDSVTTVGDHVTTLKFVVDPRDLDKLRNLHQFAGTVFFVALIPEDESRTQRVIPRPMSEPRPQERPDELSEP